jgi:hypothetical protein
MGQTLAQLSAACHDALAADPGIEGRKRLCGLIQQVLTDKEFIAAYLGDDGPERKVLYEDKELGFCILAHVNRGARGSAPHDHGPSWAIYGQAQGETIMCDWQVVEPATEDKPGRVRLVREYRLTPGMAYIYNEGDLHSPRRTGATKLIRVEGRNLELIRRLAYQAI